MKIFQNLTDLISEWDRFETTTAGNPKYQYELIYKRDFLDNEDHTLIFSATGNLFTKEQSSSFKTKLSKETLHSIIKKQRPIMDKLIILLKLTMLSLSLINGKLKQELSSQIMT